MEDIMQELDSIQRSISLAEMRLRPASTLGDRAGSIELLLHGCAQRLCALESRLRKEAGTLSFTHEGVEYGLTAAKGRIYTEFEGNCYSVPYEAAAAALKAGLDSAK